MEIYKHIFTYSHYFGLPSGCPRQGDRSHDRYRRSEYVKGFVWLFPTKIFQLDIFNASSTSAWYELQPRGQGISIYCGPSCFGISFSANLTCEGSVVKVPRSPDAPFCIFSPSPTIHSFRPATISWYDLNTQVLLVHVNVKSFESTASEISRHSSSRWSRNFLQSVYPFSYKPFRHFSVTVAKRPSKYNVEAF